LLLLQSPSQRFLAIMPHRKGHRDRKRARDGGYSSTARDRIDFAIFFFLVNFLVPNLLFLSLASLSHPPNSPKTKKLPQSSRPAARRAGPVAVRAGFFGSPENIIIIASTTAFLGASRFGLAPSATKTSTAGLKLVAQNPGLKSNDPAGFTAADVLGAGALGHGIGVGVILGLRALGKI
jgi:photosystem I subunit 10